MLIKNIDDLKNIMPEKNIDEQYLKQYEIYRTWLNEYLVEKLELRKYDDEIFKSNCKFKHVSEEKMDLYQYLSKNILRYFYIRNNVCIERLDDYELEKLNNRIINKQYEFDDEVKKFIESTYQKVIFEDVGQDGKIYSAFYGPSTSKYMAQNNSVVIGFRYDDYYSDGMSDSEWGELREKQLQLIQEKAIEILEEQKNKINSPIAIIQYNDFSVVNRINVKNERNKGVDR